MKFDLRHLPVANRNLQWVAGVEDMSFHVIGE